MSDYSGMRERMIAAAPEMYSQLYEVLQFMRGKTSYEGDEYSEFAADISELLDRIDEDIP